MMLEAVWFKDGKEVYNVCPVMNIVCDDDMNSISNIEVENEYDWYSCNYADDFIIRVKRD